MSIDDITRIYQRLFPPTPLNPGGSIEHTPSRPKEEDSKSIFDTEDKVTIGVEAKQKAQEDKAAADRPDLRLLRGRKR